MHPENLKGFMLDICKDPSKAAAIQADFESVLASTQLSQEEKEIIRSRNQDRIQQALDPNITSPSASSGIDKADEKKFVCL